MYSDVIWCMGLDGARAAADPQEHEVKVDALIPLEEAVADGQRAEQAMVQEC